MSAVAYSIEQHRLATDSRQFGLWCFRIDERGRRTVVGHSIPVGYNDVKRWSVYLVRKEIGKALTRSEAEEMLHDLGGAAVASRKGQP